MGSTPCKSDNVVSSMSSMLQRDKNVDFQAHNGADGDIPFLCMAPSNSTFSAENGYGGPLNHVGNALPNDSNKMNLRTEFSNISQHLITDHNVTVKNDTFTLNNQVSSFHGSGFKMKKGFEPLTPDNLTTFHNGMHLPAYFSGFCWPDTERSFMPANYTSMRSSHQTSVDGAGNSGSNANLMIGEDISSIRDSCKPDTLQKVDDSHIMVNTLQPQSLKTLDGSFLSLGYGDGTGVSGYGSCDYDEGSGGIGDRCFLHFEQPFYQGSLNSTMNTVSFSDVPNTVCGVSGPSSDVVCSILPSNNKGVSEITSSGFYGGPSDVLQRQHIGMHEWKPWEEKRISGIGGHRETEFAEMKSQACLTAASLSANSPLEPAGISTLPSASMIERTNHQVSTYRLHNFDMGASMVLPPQLSFTSAAGEATGRSRRHDQSSKTLHQDAWGIQTTENIIGSTLLAGGIPPVSSGHHLEHTFNGPSLKRNLLQPSVGMRRVRPRTMPQPFIHQFHPPKVPAADTEDASLDHLLNSNTFPNTSFFLPSALDSKESMTPLPRFSPIPYSGQIASAFNNLRAAAEASSSSSLPPPNASGSASRPFSFPRVPYAGAPTVIATKKSVQTSNGRANSSCPTSTDSIKGPTVPKASAKSAAAEAASLMIPKISAASARVSAVQAAEAKSTVKPDMAAVARLAKLAALAKSSRSLEVLAKNASAPHIQWEGIDQTPQPSGIKCLLCKRDLSYEPEGPISQTDPPVAVLPCGHTFHDHCLEVITPVDQSKTPPCIPCAIGEA